MSFVAHRPLTNDPAFGPLSVAHRSPNGGGVGRMIRLWRSRVRERRAFASVEDRELRDLGLSRWHVESELAKPFWRG